ncbi:hypothetical protein [Geobacter sp. DSM 9736]|uniref:hypothetical protein n=1 Tax=Geobacter sp. DSM 9736 TaxID=1277350 RepID=UPI000B511E52|nr:hypothetical protein [Geobacter sp. DSM 9736]SNB47386.1 hypothetical protein SAMN06269301_2873 [Geobacter sp. DSM 9736]
MQKKFHKLVLIAAAMAPLIPFDSAHAIPAFTRQYKTECSTCHTIYPELNEYGEVFLKNGYVYVNHRAAEKPALPAIQGEGDPSQLEFLKRNAAIPQSGNTAKETNEAILLSGIPDFLPISFSASQDIAYDDNAADKLDLATRALVLQVGGAFRDKAGFFGTFNLYTEGRYDPFTSNVPGNNSSTVRELFLVWRHAFDTPVNIRIGRLKPKLSLWKSSNRATVTSFAPHVYRVGRSQFTLDSPADALEANAVLANRLFVAAGVVDRNGQDSKEGYGHVSFKVGGADFVGNEPEIDFEKEESIFDYLMLTCGVYGYYGRNASVIASVADKTNKFYRAGADVDLSYKRLRLRLSGVKGKDDNPDFISVPQEVDSTVMAAEAELLIGSEVITTFRYEHQDDGTGITRRYIPAVAYAPLQNIRLVAEYKHEISAPATNRLGQIGITFSF